MNIVPTPEVANLTFSYQFTGLKSVPSPLPSESAYRRRKDAYQPPYQVLPGLSTRASAIGAKWLTPAFQFFRPRILELNGRPGSNFGSTSVGSSPQKLPQKHCLLSGNSLPKKELNLLISSSIPRT